MCGKVFKLSVINSVCRLLHLLILFPSSDISVLVLLWAFFFLVGFFLLLRERLTLMRIDLRCLAMQHRVSLLRVQLLWNFICVGHTHIKWFDLMCLRFFRRNEIAKKQKLCVGFFTVLCDSNDYYIRWLNRFLHTNRSKQQAIEHRSFTCVLFIWLLVALFNLDNSVANSSEHTVLASERAKKVYNGNAVKTH